MKFTSYIGTYTTRGSKGVYLAETDSESGEMALLDAFPAVNPSYLTISGEYLFAALETGEMDGVKGGGAAAYKIGAGNRLDFVSKSYTHGSSPCHVRLSANGKKLFVANYGDGKVSVFPCENGVLGEATVIQHEGSGPNPARQERPHAHCVENVPGKNQVCAIDLGIDSAIFYNAETLAKEGEFHTNPGAGPRHVVFSPDGRFAWLLTELSNEVYAFKPYGGYERVSVVSSLPDGFSGESSGAAIKLSPCGKYLFASNRFHDTVSSFEVDQETGAVVWISEAPAGGKVPRDITVSPDGRFLYCANQESDNITIFKIAADGKLGQTGEIAVPAPVCVIFKPVQ